MDLVLERPSGAPIAVEIKATAAPALGKGFHAAREDLAPAASFVVHAGEDRYPLRHGVEGSAFASSWRCCRRFELRAHSVASGSSATAVNQHSPHHNEFWSDEPGGE